MCAPFRCHWYFIVTVAGAHVPGIAVSELTTLAVPAAFGIGVEDRLISAMGFRALTLLTYL